MAKNAFEFHIFDGVFYNFLEDINTPVFCSMVLDLLFFLKVTTINIKEEPNNYSSMLDNKL